MTRLRSTLRRYLPGAGQWPLVSVNLAVVVLAATITALLALVVEDWLPVGPASPAVAEGVWGRRGWLFGVLGMLVIAVVVRTAVKSSRGTLFYVQLLDDSMANWHKSPLQAAEERHLAVKWVLRWISLSRRTQSGVIDLVEPCTELAHTVQSEINADTADTGYTLAPNTLWPVSFALGASLPNPDRLTLLEFANNQENENDTAISLQSKEATTSSLERDELEMKPPTGDRVGVWVALTKSANQCNEKKFRPFGVGTLHRITYEGRFPGVNGWEPKFGKKELERFGRELADLLGEIKEQAGSRELVVIAMMPKTTALAAGWYLSGKSLSYRENGRRIVLSFFENTHLMNFDMPTGQYVPMRVSESQPTLPPSTGETAGAGDDHTHA